MQQQLAALQAAYETLNDAPWAADRYKNSHPSAAESDSLPDDRLLILCAIEAIQALVMRGYMELRDNPYRPGTPIITVTEQGQIAVDKAVSREPWAEFPFRPGDIVISTSPKSGTTWMQMICALLIFQTSVLPASIPELSPDMESVWPAERARIKELAAQQDRRLFVKTHSPLSAIPADPDVTYIVVARNPLDAAVSLYYQQSIPMSTNDSGQPNGSERPHESVRQFVLDRIEEMDTTQKDERGSFIDRMLKSLSCAWQRRAEPNVVLVHYEDLSADLQGEMRQLARRLNIKVPEDIWPSLVQSATFKEMRAAADQLRPLQYEKRREASKEYAAFFRRGSSGDGRALLNEAELARYYTLASQVAPQELLAWLHRYPDGGGTPMAGPA